MKRVAFIIILTIVIVALVAIVVFSVNPQQPQPRTNSTQPEVNNLSKGLVSAETAGYIPTTITKGASK